jgi:hypothetical protein
LILPRLARRVCRSRRFCWCVVSRYVNTRRSKFTKFHVNRPLPHPIVNVSCGLLSQAIGPRFRRTDVPERGWQVNRSENSMQYHVRLAALAVFCVMASSAWAQEALVTLIHRPKLGIPADTAPRPAGTGPLDIDAFPRLAGAEPTIVRINAALDRADARAMKAVQQCVAASPGRSSWTRSIDVTMAGPRFVSFVSHDDTYCGGPHPNSSTVVLVYDLTTGRPADWTKLIPARFGGKPGTTEGADGTVLGTLSSPRLKALYIREMKPDAECRDVLNDTSFNFMFWPDAQANGLVMDQDDLAHVSQACGGSVTLSTKTLREMGADAGMIDAIEAAHVLQAASPAGTYAKHENGNATLTMTDRGGQWEAVIEAGGIPRGEATAADCNFSASGQVTGHRFEGQIVRDDGVPGIGGGKSVAPGSMITITFTPELATITEAKVNALCGDGIDISGRYPRKNTP